MTDRRKSRRPDQFSHQLDHTPASPGTTAHTVLDINGRQGWERIPLDRGTAAEEVTRMIEERK